VVPLNEDGVSVNDFLDFIKLIVNRGNFVREEQFTCRVFGVVRYGPHVSEVTNKNDEVGFPSAHGLEGQTPAFGIMIGYVSVWYYEDLQCVLPSL